MTRFARAKGSKASNERVEEEATPWAELKSFATPNSKKVRYDVEDIADNFNENEEDYVTKNEFNVESDSDESDDEKPEDQVKDLFAKNPDKIPNDTEPVAGKKKRKRSQNKCLNCKQPGHLKRDCPDLSEERRQELQKLVQMKVERKGQGTGRKKNKRKLTEKLEDNNENSPPPTKKFAPNKEENKKDKNDKGKVLKDKTGQVVLEGEGLFQGFRVLKEDVQRLRELHAKLEKEKISAAEIKEVLKRERRKAEKFLAKSKKNVCFQCREPGHVLNDCPQQKTSKSISKMGNCFKCGSNEHTSKDCESKLKGADAYRFAECFVCKQTGHLAKACPDNPKGLYPKGGGCRFCGSVEHLKSECPRKAQKDARSEVRVMKQSDHAHLEDEPIEPSRPKIVMKKKPKVVSF